MKKILENPPVYFFERKSSLCEVTLLFPIGLLSNMEKENYSHIIEHLIIKKILRSKKARILLHKGIKYRARTDYDYTTISLIALNQDKYFLIEILLETIENFAVTNDEANQEMNIITKEHATINYSNKKIIDLSLESVSLNKFSEGFFFKTRNSFGCTDAEKITNYFNSFYKRNFSLLIISSELNLEKSNLKTHYNFTHSNTEPILTKSNFKTNNKEKSIQVDSGRQKGYFSLVLPWEIKKDIKLVDIVRNDILLNIVACKGVHSAIQKHLRENKKLIYTANSVILYRQNIIVNCLVGACTNRTKKLVFQELENCLKNLTVSDNMVLQSKNQIYIELQERLESQDALSDYLSLMIMLNIKSYHISDYINLLHSISTEEIKQYLQKLIKNAKKIILT